MTLQSISKRTDWEQMTKEVFALIRRLRRNPQRLGYSCSPGGILNAYREGGVTFKGAVKALENWKDRELKRASVPKSGDIIIVIVGDKSYETIIDESGVQRFRANKLLTHLQKSRGIDLNQLALDYENGKFTQEEYLHFYMGLGYSVCGLSDLSFFEDLRIENPLW